MKKYQIYERMPAEINHAVSKAPADVAEIAKNMGFEELYIYKTSNEYDFKSKVQRQFNYFKDWQNAYKCIENNSVLLLQHPFRTRQFGREKYLRRLKEKKSVKIISLIHDVEELRQSLFNDYYKNEFNFMLSLADIIIVHNESMMNFFVKKGFSKDKLINLHVFDYLRKDYQSNIPTYSNNITIAGNLDVKKATYLKDLNKIKNNFILYGPNYSLHDYKNCKYCGIVPTSEIPNELKSGWGLIWDGTSVNTCDGPTGNYLQYNNPHKLSLYLSSNLPVIIWDKAAEANFVRNNKVGITVSSLHELSDKFNNIDKVEYEEYAKNARIIGERLAKGYYTEIALKRALEKS